MHCANPKAPNEVLVIDNARSDSDTGSRAILYKVNEQSKISNSSYGSSTSQRLSLIKP